MTKRTPITVIAEFNVAQLVPLSMVWYDGRVYCIDAVLDVQKAANRKVGGAGMRYTVRIRGQQRVLWREKDSWFVEEEVDEELSS